MSTHGDEAEALARYASDGPPEHGLAAVRRLRRLLDTWETAQVAAARARGWSWGDIGRVLGRSRQAVHSKYRASADTDVDTDTANASKATWNDYERALRDLGDRRRDGSITEAEWNRRLSALEQQLR